MTRQHGCFQNTARTHLVLWWFVTHWAIEAGWVPAAVSVTHGQSKISGKELQNRHIRMIHGLHFQRSMSHKPTSTSSCVFFCLCNAPLKCCLLISLGQLQERLRYIWRHWYVSSLAFYIWTWRWAWKSALINSLLLSGTVARRVFF